MTENFERGPALAWIWIISSIFIWISIMSSLQPTTLSKDDFYCNGTQEECRKITIEQIKKETIENSEILQEKLSNLNDIFPSIALISKFGLISSPYSVLIVDKGSQIEGRVSNSSKNIPGDIFDVSCYVLSKEQVLKNGGFIELGTLSIKDIKKENINNALTSLIDKFGGCYPRLMVEKNYKLHPDDTLYPPNTIISLHFSLRQSIEFKLHGIIALTILGGIFTLIGIFFSSIRQLFKICKKGLFYLYGEE